MSLDAGEGRRERLCSDLTLAALPAAACSARRHARDVLTAWGLAAVADTTELLVAELVTNALRAAGPAGPAGPAGSAGPAGPGEAGGQVRMRLIHAGVRLWVAVWDGDERPPVPGVTGIADAEAEGGRGLLLVESLSLDWGWFPSQRGGKVVWCELGAVRLAGPGPAGGP